ncbi:phenylalanyl-tRNA synthetase subunit alpha [Pedobacter lusitanus]|uniref:Contig15, whole genome shotgun sequence n=1 Tax=Pedobacter lusitanus TaxID=1503925 RepID=A0A0D0GMG1_9SPHI|nr:M90 family metallopeptidase [Pedobacter lusitanus]KIO78367.1 phenylalanyl-tRNA synthetase subunit alpha [Pedobacter lusitanus]
MTTYLILLAAFLIALYFIFRNKKSKQLPENIIGEAERQLLLSHVAYYKNLDAANRTKFEQMLEDFLSDVRIEGIDLTPDRTDRLLIASSAVIPVFGFGQWKYKNLHAVILYPDTFNKDFQFEGGDRNILGMVGTGYMNGQMILSRSALLEGFSISADKENTAIHEFVHLLDKSDGATDGIPENLMPHQYIIPWVKMIHQEINQIEAGKSDINPYAVTNEAEFFAVVSEYFFEKPAQFKDKHPELYQILSTTFSQDPVTR